MMKTTAIAHSNIALVKYWGKRDSDLILPYNSSVSMTLDKLHTITTVDFNRNLDNHEIIIDDSKLGEKEFSRVAKHVDMIKKIAGIETKARIVSKNNFPKKAGLASSASAFAALTVATTNALDLELSSKELSILSRKGSGSASRSIVGGFVEWMKGTRADGTDSYAKQIASKDYWPGLTMIVTILNPGEKKTGSRSGMKQTVSTSPLYKGWLESVEKDVREARKGIIDRDFSLLGKTMELNALKMHATMHTTAPPLIYWEPETITLIKEVISLREEGTESYFTMDAGPQVKILCLDRDVPTILERLSGIEAVKDHFICHPGNGATTIQEHLF